MATRADQDLLQDLLRGRLDRLEERLAKVERHLGFGAEESRSALIPPSAPDVGVTPTLWSADSIPLVGRTLLALGGAFILRAVTEAGLLHRAAGAGLGIAYAVTWFLLADRAAARGKLSSAAFHVITATIIAFPLIWETTAQFGYLTPWTSALLLVAVAAAGLAVSWRRDLQGLGAVVTVAATATTIVLSVSTRALLPFGVCLLTLGAATLALAWAKKWIALSWIVAVPTYVVFVLIVLIVARVDADKADQLIGAAAALGLQLGLVLVYVGSLIAGTLRTRSDLTPGPIALGGLATVIGLAGAVAVTRVAGSGHLALGGAALVLGGASYLVSFTLADRSVPRVNFVFYSTLALAFTLVACQALFAGLILVASFSAAALLLAWLGSWRRRATLSLHGAVYVAVSFVVSGLAAMTLTAFVAPAGVARGEIGLPGIIVIAAAAVCSVLPVATHGRTWGRVSRIPKLVVIALAVCGLGSAVIPVLAGVLEASGRPDAATLAVVRTGVIAAAALAVSALGRIPRIEEAMWLAYPLLVAGGLKLIAEDLRVGRPATLVFSFILYGGALILVPWLTRWSRRHLQSEAAS